MIVEKMYVLLILGVYFLLTRIDGQRLCSCYTFSKDQWLWPQARTNCKNNNKILAVMESEQEWQFITTEIQNKTGTLHGEWFIGLKQNLTTRRWSWINGKPLTIEKWHKSGTNPDLKDSYGVIHEEYPSGFKGSLSTIRSDQPRGWICEEETDTCRGICFHHSVPTTTSYLGPSTGTKAVTTEGKTSTEQDITAVSREIIDRLLILGSSRTVSTPDTAKSTDKVLLDDKGSASPTIMIVAASLGAVLFVSFIILVAVIFLRRKKRQGKDAESAPPKTHSLKMSVQKNSEKEQFGESQYESVNPVEAAKLLGSANSTPDNSKTRFDPPSENCEYAVVNRANKKRKEGDLVYAQLAEFGNETDTAKPPKPPSYEPTIYADVEELPPELPGREDPDSPQPTYANLETTGV